MLGALTNGLQFRHLLVVQALATAAVVATNGIRCSQAEAMCPGSGDSFQSVAAVLTHFSSPFMPMPEWVAPRPACYAVLGLMQVTLGYWLVLALKWRSEAEKRMCFAAARGLRRVCQQLQQLRGQGSPLWLSLYFAAAMTWQAGLFIVRDQAAPTLA